MSTQVSPTHNTKALTIATAEFSFSHNATSAADAQARGYLDLGNIKSINPGTEPTKQEHFGSYRGIRRSDKTVVTQDKISYKVVVDELNKKNLEILLGGTSIGEFSQAALTAAAGTVLGFTATPAVIGKWYDILTAAGAQLRRLTTVTIATKVEGTDFELDLTLGRVRFLTAQAADLTPTITCAAITSGSATGFENFTPLLEAVKTGYGRVVMFDTQSGETVVYDHYGFNCDVAVDSVSDIDGEKFTEITLTVTVKDVVGVVQIRNGNVNAGIAA